MDVILVNPAGGTSWQDRNRKSDSEQYMYPYSLIYLMNFLSVNGIVSRLFDLYYTNPRELIEHCRELDNPIVGVTAQTYNRDGALKTIREIKAASPGARIVVGGKHFTYCAEETLEHIPEIDVVVRGEGEITFHEVVKALQSNGSLDGIEGISFRSKGEILRNKERELERDIDKFTLDYETLPLGDFEKGVFLRNYENEGIKSLPVILGRGCSQSCIFCVYKQMKYRVRNLDSVMSEITYLRKKYNQRYFTFSDPSFTERRTFTKEFCETLIREKLEIEWYCEARADTPPELLELMREAGCISLDFAIESGSPKILKVIRKNIKLDQAHEFALNCKKLGIRTLVFFMVSLPDETEEDAGMTLDLIRSFNEYTRYIAVGAAQIFPGTELEAIARRRKILPEDFTWYDDRFYHDNPDLGPVNVPLYLEHLSVDYIRRFLKEVEKIRFAKYSNSADLWRLMKRGARRLPNQPLSKSVRDIARFTRGVGNKLVQSIKPGD